MLGQSGRQLAARREQIGERRLPNLQHRIGVVDDIKLDRTVVTIDNCLDAVADVVERLVETRRRAELAEVGALPVWVAVRDGVTVGDPHHATIADHRVRIGIEFQERRQFGHPILDLTDPHHSRIAIDCAGPKHVVVQEMNRKRQTAHRRTELDTAVTLVRAAGLLVGAGLFADRRLDDGKAIDTVAEIQFGPRETRGVLIVGKIAARTHLTGRGKRQPTAVSRQQMHTLPRLVGQATNVQFSGPEDHLSHGAVDRIPIDVEVVDQQP